MSQLDPSTTSIADICVAALKESGALGVGQRALAEDISDAAARLQWMLQQWNRRRWLVWHLQDLSVVSTGAQSYSVGPGGDLDTSYIDNPFNKQFNSQFGPQPRNSVRPAKIESAFIRQITESQPNQIDYPMRLIHSREDYNRIALKQLKSFPGWLFYDSAWPLGTVYPWPVPDANIYELHISVMDQFPSHFTSLTDVLNVPYECYAAMLYNLALRLRVKYSIPTFPGDQLPGQAAESLAVLRGANTQIAQLVMPGDLLSGQQYNIFSDRMY